MENCLSRRGRGVFYPSLVEHVLLLILFRFFKKKLLPQYLRYFPHIFANIVDLDTRQRSSSSLPSPFSPPLISFCAPCSSFLLHLVYLFPICFLITMPLPWSTLTFWNCLLSISIRPIKKIRMTHSRPLNGMTEGERHKAKCRPRRVR